MLAIAEEEEEERQKGKVALDEATEKRLKEMEEKGLLHQIASENDGRVTYITVTEAGKKLSKKYDEEYFTGLSSALSDISEEEADCMIQTIEKFYERMRERRTHYDK